MTNIAKKQCTIVIHDEVYCTLKGLTLVDYKSLYDALGIEVPGAFFMTAVKLGRWDGKIRFVDANGNTYNNMIPEILPMLMRWGYEFNIEDARVFNPPLTEVITPDYFGDTELYGSVFRLHQHQCDYLNALIKAGGGIGLAATGAGKTAMSAALCEAYSRAGYRPIIIVPSDDLVNQTYKTFKALGMDAGRYSGSFKEPDASIIVATWQSLRNVPTMMRDFKCAIVDECHGAKANVIQELLTEYGKHIPWKFGITGTLPKPESDQYLIRSVLGDVQYEITARWLIDNGFLAELDIEIWETKDDLSLELPDYTAEKTFLGKQEDRIEAVAKFVKKARDEYGNTLVLTNNNQFGKKIVKHIDGSEFLFGDSKNKDRFVHYDAFDVENDKILVASSGIAKQGISIDRVFCLVLIDPIKSFTTIIQSVGRGLRLAHDKNFVKVYDISSNMKYGRKHRKNRVKYYKECEYPCTKGAKHLKYLN